MRLRSLASLQKVLVFTTLACLPLMAPHYATFGEERRVDPLFLELDKKYRTPEQWNVLPFELEDPWKRVKNGPPLANIINKAKVEWMSRWISNPKKVVPNAKMPNLGLNFEEIKAVIVYLSSIKEKELPKIEWDA